MVRQGLVFVTQVRHQSPNHAWRKVLRILCSICMGPHPSLTMNEADWTVSLRQKLNTKLRRLDRAVSAPFTCITIGAAVSESDQARYHSSSVSEFQPAANFHPERKMTVILL